MAQPSSATAQVNENESVPSQGQEDFGITGDWMGKRIQLAEKGYNLGVIYKGDLFRNMSGGDKIGGGYIQNLDLRLLMDLERAFGFKGTRFYVSGFGNWGSSGNSTPSALVGDEQGTSNIETPRDDFRLYELWAEFNLFEDKISILYGIHDLNSDFYVTDTSGLFLNASLGIGKDASQAGVAGPSAFPYTTASFRIRVNPIDRFYLQSGIFNAIAGLEESPKKYHHSFNVQDGFLLINEGAYVGPEDKPSKYGMGYWTFTTTFDNSSEDVTNQDGNTEAKQVNSSGVYFLADHFFTPDWSTFLRAGFATSASNDTKNNISGGTAIKGLIPSRAEDSLGIAFTRIEPSQANGQNKEFTWELTYRAEIIKGISLQPDLQYVINPGFSTTVKQATYGALRLEVNF